MLAIVGGLFLFFSVSIVATAFITSVRKGRDVTAEDVFQWLGIAGMFVWIPVVLGVAGWLVSLPFGGAYWLMEWIERGAPSTGPIVPVALVALLLVIVSAGLIGRRARTLKRADPRP